MGFNLNLKTEVAVTEIPLAAEVAFWAAAVFFTWLTLLATAITVAAVWGRWIWSAKPTRRPLPTADAVSKYRHGSNCSQCPGDLCDVRVCDFAAVEADTVRQEQQL